MLQIVGGGRQSMTAPSFLYYTMVRMRDIVGQVSKFREFTLMQRLKGPLGTVF